MNRNICNIQVQLSNIKLIVLHLATFYGEQKQIVQLSLMIHVAILKQHKTSLVEEDLLYRQFLVLTDDASSSVLASEGFQVLLHQTQQNLMRSAEADEAPTHDNRKTVVNKKNQTSCVLRV